MKTRGTWIIVAGVVLTFWLANEFGEAAWAGIVVIIIGAVVRGMASRPSKTVKVQSLPGWTHADKDDTIGILWGRAVPELPVNDLRNVYRGTAFRRPIVVFQAGGPGASVPTFIAFPLNTSQGQFVAESNGRDEVSVNGAVNDRVSAMLQAITATRMRRAGVAPNGTFWLQVPDLPPHALEGFIRRRLHGLVQAVVKTMTASDPMRTLAELQGTQPEQPDTSTSTSGGREAAPPPAPSRKTTTDQPPAQQPAAQQPAAARRAPRQRPAGQTTGSPTAQASRDRTPLHTPTPLVHPTPSAQTAELTPTVKLTNDPNEILRTGPIEQVDRPALKKAKADPIAEQLDNPVLQEAWAPPTWETPSIELTPIRLGSASTDYGWAPREWSPPEYGGSAVGEWQPAPAWQPHYSDVGDHADTD